MAEINMGTFSSVDAALAEIARLHRRTAAYRTPWWGDKDTESGNMTNRGFVIGFRDAATSAQWRLDYDPGKGLHINWTQERAQQETSKECYYISGIRPQDTMWEYYIGWTRPRFDAIPADIKARLDSVGGTKKWSGRYWSA